VIGAQLLRASRARTCSMAGSVNAGRNTREEERERRGSPSPATSFPDGSELRAARCVRAVLRARMWVCCRCKEESGSSSSA
jgi:hypothetical protein